MILFCFVFKVLSILPRAGASAMNISFDEQTKNELRLLKGNIEGLLKMNSDFWFYNVIDKYIYFYNVVTSITD